MSQTVMPAAAHTTLRIIFSLIALVAGTLIVQRGCAEHAARVESTCVPKLESLENRLAVTEAELATARKRAEDVFDANAVSMKHAIDNACQGQIAGCTAERDAIRQSISVLGKRCDEERGALQEITLGLTASAEQSCTARIKAAEATWEAKFDAAEADHRSALEQLVSPTLCQAALNNVEATCLPGKRTEKKEK